MELNEQQKSIIDYAKDKDFVIPMECASVLNLDYCEEFGTIIRLLYTLVDVGLMRIRECEGLAFEVL